MIHVLVQRVCVFLLVFMCNPYVSEIKTNPFQMVPMFSIIFHFQVRSCFQCRWWCFFSPTRNHHRDGFTPPDIAHIPTKPTQHPWGHNNYSRWYGQSRVVDGDIFLLVGFRLVWEVLVSSVWQWWYCNYFDHILWVSVWFVFGKCMRKKEKEKKRYLVYKANWNSY